MIDFYQWRVSIGLWHCYRIPAAKSLATWICCKRIGIRVCKHFLLSTLLLQHCLQYYLESATLPSSSEDYSAKHFLRLLAVMSLQALPSFIYKVYKHFLLRYCNTAFFQWWWICINGSAVDTWMESLWQEIDSNTAFFHVNGSAVDAWMESPWSRELGNDGDNLD